MHRLIPRFASPFASPVACAGLLLGLTLAATPTGQAGEAANPLTASFLNDGAIRDAVVAEGRRLVEDGQTLPLATLREQMDRRACPLPLPAPASGLSEPGGPAADAEAATLIIACVHYCRNCERFESNNASGFVISADGLAVTNYHVLDAAPQHGRAKDDDEDQRAGFVALTRSGEAWPIVEVVAANPAADVALVRLGLPEGRTLSALPLAAAGRLGEDVHCISHPAGRFFSYSRGVVTRRHMTRRHGEETPRLSVTADYARGSSGAAMVNVEGAVVGIVTTTDSVYYSERGGQQRDLQMVFRDCVPVESLQALFAPPTTEDENTLSADASPDNDAV
ncbi:S1 family peptidase [Alienimonas californiensis]|uniref:Putative periplasmic serine endoprotease DegP-like n=1 Tax=Alienimonas californiensis TaxID=2527989 RepID=A0A517PAN7_9PLAN|nr:serine protease [Alienimonas californiensis]QDT16438.1 putative periplasmic serine endoprotease DegP-like precursor [Alienimonas californiensis]